MAQYDIDIIAGGMRMLHQIMIGIGIIAVYIIVKREIKHFVQNQKKKG